ncbi:hypothetical protein [Microbacterium sp. 10M-3C3]|uniref:hypothetical protein n=1 Tax=Microbacterium sp. 10M-3C3 TaxID=2483401 RepID=UPI001F0BE286|nr:hypothetical protein [Microbacterium sp. 10M-3C3]
MAMEAVRDGERAGHDLALWLADGVSARMFYAGRRWTVSDMPTVLLRDGRAHGAHTPADAAIGWRFQATDPSGDSIVFDVYADAGHWHVHRTYA